MSLPLTPALLFDLIAANGKVDASVLQRCIWAFTEGGVAIGLMVAGGNDSTSALQALSICCGLPFTVFLCVMCTSLYRELSKDEDAPKSNEFAFPVWGGVFDVMEFLVSGFQSRLPSGEIWVDTIKGIVFPTGALMEIQNKMHYDKFSVIFSGIVTITCWYGCWICQIYSVVVTNDGGGLWAIGWAFYGCFAILMALDRYAARAHYGITNGNIFEDFCVAFLLPFQGAAQLYALAKTDPPKKTDGGGGYDVISKANVEKALAASN